MNTRLFKRCVALSRDLAEFDQLNRQKHFSYLCLRNKIIATGINEKWKTDKLANFFKYRFNSIHAELKCIKPYIRIIEDFSKFTLVNVRLNANLDVMLSKPCEKCQIMLDFFGVNDVFYSVSELSYEKL